MKRFLIDYLIYGIVFLISSIFVFMLKPYQLMAKRFKIGFSLFWLCFILQFMWMFFPNLFPFPLSWDWEITTILLSAMIVAVIMMVHSLLVQKEE